MRSFFGMIKFVWCFITIFVEFVKPLNDMMKKDNKIKWSPETKTWKLLMLTGVEKVNFISNRVKGENWP